MGVASLSRRSAFCPPFVGSARKPLAVPVAAAHGGLAHANPTRRRQSLTAPNVASDICVSIFPTWIAWGFQMSGFSSTTTTLNYAKPPVKRVELEFEGTDTQALVHVPARGIALGVALSVPLWGVLAWAVHLVAKAV